MVFNADPGKASSESRVNQPKLALACGVPISPVARIFGRSIAHKRSLDNYEKSG